MLHYPQNFFHKVRFSYLDQDQERKCFANTTQPKLDKKNNYKNTEFANGSSRIRVNSSLNSKTYIKSAVWITKSRRYNLLFLVFPGTY